MGESRLFGSAFHKQCATDPEIAGTTSSLLARAIFLRPDEREGPRSRWMSDQRETLAAGAPASLSRGDR